MAKRTLSLTSGVNDIMAYFLTEWGGELAKVQVSGLIHTERVGQLVAKQLTPSVIRRLLDRGTKIAPRLENKAARLMLKSMIAIYKSALQPARSPASEGPKPNGPAAIGQDKGFPRMRLTQNANMAYVMLYFLGRFGPPMDTATLKDLRERPVQLAQALRKTVPQPYLEKLLAKAVEAQGVLTDPRALTRLSRYILPVLQGAYRGDGGVTAPPQAPPQARPVAPPPLAPPVPAKPPTSPPGGSGAISGPGSGAGKATKVPRMRLTQAASPEQVLKYFFHRYGGVLSGITAMDLANRAGDVAQNIRDRIPAMEIEVLYARADEIRKKGMRDPLSNIMIRALTPILKTAVTAPATLAPPTPPAPSVSLTDRLFAKYIKSLGGELGDMELTHLITRQERIVALLEIHLMLEGTGALRELHGERGRIRPGESAENRGAALVMDQIIDLYKRAIGAMTGTLANVEEDKFKGLIFEGIAPGLPHTGAVSFGQIFKEKFPSLDAQLEALGRVQEVSAVLSSYHRGRMNFRDVSQRLTYYTVEQLKRILDPVNKGFSLEVSREMAEPVQRAVLELHPGFKWPAGVELSVEGLRSHFFTIYSPQAAPLSDPAEIGTLSPRLVTILRGVPHKAEIERKLKEAKHLLAYIQEQEDARRFDRSLAKLSTYLAPTITLYTRALEGPVTGSAHSTVKMPPTTAPGRGEGNPSNRNLPPDDSYFVRIQPAGTPATDRFLGAITDLHATGDQTTAALIEYVTITTKRLTPAQILVSRSTSVSNALSVLFARMVMEGRIDRRTAATLGKAIDKDLWGTVTIAPFTQTFNRVWAAIQEGVKNPIGPPSIPEAIKVSPSVTPQIRSECREAYNKAREIMSRSAIPRAAHTLRGLVEFTKPRKGANIRTLGNFSAASNLVRVQGFTRQEGGILATLIHELGHRYHTHVIDRQVWLEFLNYNRMLVAPQKPWVGKKVVIASKIPYSISSKDLPALFNYGEILEVKGSGYNTRVVVRSTSFPGRLNQDSYQESMDREYPWSQIESVRTSNGVGFPSEYGRSNPHEHFAETWAGYHLGALAPDLREHFESLLIQKEPASNLKIARIRRASMPDGEIEFLEPEQVYANVPRDVSPVEIIKVLQGLGFVAESVTMDASRYLIEGVPPNQGARMVRALETYFPGLVPYWDEEQHYVDMARTSIIEG